MLNSRYRILLFKAGKRMVDGLIAALAFVMAYQIAMPSYEKSQILVLASAIAVLRIGTNALFGIYRQQWRYITLGDAAQVLKVYLFASAVLLAGWAITSPEFVTLRIPVSLILLELALSLPGALGARFLRRMLYERKSASSEPGRPSRLLLVGAGHHGVTVAKQIAGSKGTTMVGFVDDDPRKAGAVICGVPVLGPTSALSEVCQTHKVDEVLICIPPAARKPLNLDTHLFAPKVRSKIVPTIEEILHSEESPVSSRPSGNGKHPTSPNFPRAVPCPVRGKTVLITGGAGFIGSSLAEKLVADNRVVLFDLQFEGKPVEFTSLRENPNVKIVRGDLLDGTNLEGLAAEADIIVHAAAIVGVKDVCNAGRKTLETNYVGTSRLLQAAAKARHLERLIYFSTSEVFGVNSFRVNENSPPSIGSISEARWSYAIAKLAGEHLAKSYHREIGLPISIVRPFNVFGPKRTGDHALLRFIMNSLHGQPIEVHSDGSQIRSWCYIDDFCAALLAMMSRAEAVGEDFNIGHPGNTLTIHALASKVVELTGIDVPIIFQPAPFPDIEIRVPSLVKAQQRLGFEPHYDLELALRLTIDWYRQHKSRVSSLSDLSPVRETMMHPSAARPDVARKRAVATA